MKQLTILLQKFHDLKAKKKETEDALKDLTSKLSELDKEIQEHFIEEGTTQMRVEGMGLFTLTETVRANAADKDKLFKHLRGLGHDSLIKENVNAQTLSAWARTCLEEGATDEALSLLGCSIFRQRQMKLTK
jgi:hypothetical protein